MQLAGKQDEFKKLGIELAGVSYDPVSTLKAFAAKGKIPYPLLSDPQAEMIKGFGIFNEKYEKGHKWHGIPHPHVYYVDPQGRILGRFFEKRYQERPAPEKIMEFIKAQQAR